MKDVQPKGPDVVAGYSLGTTVAFEITKLLEGDGSQVAFLGAFDSPPHIVPLVKPLDWSASTTMVAYFLDLVSEDSVDHIASSTNNCSHDEIVSHLLQVADPIQRDALGMDCVQLNAIIDITNAFANTAKDYEPSGRVRKVDVFYATPLVSVSRSREEWLQQHLLRWSDFSMEEIGIHECAGEHARMIDTAHANSFYQKLQVVLDIRGILDLINRRNLKLEAQ